MSEFKLSAGRLAASSRTRISCLAALLSALLLMTGVAHAQYGPDDEAEALEAPKPKAEADITLPPMPQPQDMIPFNAGPTARQSYAIDAKSLTVTPDQVVRYTVVSTSPSGAKNVSFESIDCKTKTFKRHAYGGNDGQWTLSRTDKWEPVSSLSQNQFHFTLSQLYLCQAGMVVGNAAEVLERIRYQRVLGF